MFDFTHNFVNKREMHPPTLGHEHILGDKCIAQFAHLKQLYQLKEGEALKVTHALKKVSLNPSSIARMSPQHALGKIFFFNYLLDESGVSVVITFTDFDVGDAGSVHAQVSQI